MSDDLDEFERIADGLLQALSPPERRKVARRMATQLRRDQAARIAAQKNPDGTAYAPRKSRKIRGKKGAIRRTAMFGKLRAAKYLRAGVDGDGFFVGFAGRVARIARPHQEGAVDRVSPDAPTRVRYPQRVLLGDTEADRERLIDLLLDHIG